MSVEIFFVVALLGASGIGLFVLNVLKKHNEKQHYLHDDAAPIRNCKWWR